MRFIELFAGIGGFRYGLEAVHSEEAQKERDKVSRSGSADIDGEPPALWGSEPPFSCVYSNEFNKYAAQIYERNFNEQNKSSGECGERTRSTERVRPEGNSPNSKGEPRENNQGIDTRDIREVKAEEIPDHDLLTAGFPCQAFSIAGKRGGFEDTRGTLFFEIARILQQKQPRLLLLENVKGLLSHDKGQTFGTILNTLDELGYDLQWQVLNSKDFGVPQNRERVFIIGHLRGTSRPEVFPLGGTDGKALKELSQGLSQGYRTYDPRGVSTTLAGEAGGIGAKTGLYAIDMSRRQSKVREDGRASTLNANYYKGLANQESPAVLDGMKIRRLTPTECERLQGFPDGWTEGISDTQRYKCLGNAVTTNVITAIGERLI